MGLFLMMSGVAGATRAEVEDALHDFAVQRSGTMMPLTGDETADQSERLLITESEQGNITVLYPNMFTGWEDASQYLSAHLNKPVFSLHVHDGDLWTYSLLVKGQEADRFNPMPDYWEELPDEELESWSGNAAAVCQHWPNVTEEQITRYLVRWGQEDEDEEEAVNAYPEDAAAIGDAWQIVDFMAKVGLVYPAGELGSELASVYRFNVVG